MINVLHWINLSRLYRCHLTFEDTLEFTHYYITDKKSNTLKKRKHVFVGSPRSTAFLKTILNQVKPNVIVHSNVVEQGLMNLMRQNCQYMIYIHHTIWTDDILSQKVAQKRIILPKYDIFDRLYLVEKEVQAFIKMGMNPEKLKSVHGLIFMDQIMMTDYQQKKIEVLGKFVKNKTPQELLDTKTILFIHNNTLTGCLNSNGKPKSAHENSTEYGLMLNQINDYALKNDCYVFTKIGRRSSTLQENSLIKAVHKSPRVIVIRPEQDWLMADFLFCEAIINQSYSAAYQESLLANHCASCCYLNSAKELVDSTKYPDLPVIRNLSEINTTLDKFFLNRDFYYSEPVNQQVDQLIKDTFGGKIENVTEIILEEIRQKFK